MFEQFYEFEQTPFSRDIPVEHLYRVAGQEEVLSRLVYAAKMRWFAVLTGECGSGKSTIIRSLKETLDGRGYRCMYIADSSLSPRHFYNGILSQLGVEGKFYCLFGNTVYVGFLRLGIDGLEFAFFQRMVMDHRRNHHLKSNDFIHPSGRS